MTECRPPVTRPSFSIRTTIHAYGRELRLLQCSTSPKTKREIVIFQDRGRPQGNINKLVAEHQHELTTEELSDLLKIREEEMHTFDPQVEEVEMEGIFVSSKNIKEVLTMWEKVTVFVKGTTWIK